MPDDHEDLEKYFKPKCSSISHYLENEVHKWLNKKALRNKSSVSNWMNDHFKAMIAREAEAKSHERNIV